MRLVIKIKDAYFLWSTVIDAPISMAMFTKSELVDCMDNEFGIPGVMFLKENWLELQKSGMIPKMSFDLDELLKDNRAGRYEETLSPDEIYQHYRSEEAYERYAREADAAREKAGETTYSVSGSDSATTGTEGIEIPF